MPEHHFLFVSLGVCFFLFDSLISSRGQLCVQKKNEKTFFFFILNFLVYSSYTMCHLARNRIHTIDFPGDTMYKNLLSSVGDMHSISGPGRFHMPWSN